MIRNLTRAALISVILLAHPAIAQEAAEPSRDPIVLREVEARNPSLFEFDWGAPSSPALTLAGLSPDKTPTSTSLKDFVVAIPTIAGGAEQGQALALDFSPASLFSRQDPLTFNDYFNASYGEHLARRTRLGAALFEGVNDDDPAKQVASRLAIGLSVSLFGDSDPLLQRVRGGARNGQSLLLTCLDEQTPRVRSILNTNLRDVVTRPEFDRLYSDLTDEERAILRAWPDRTGALSARRTVLQTELAQPTTSEVRAEELRALIKQLDDEETRALALWARVLDLQFSRTEAGQVSIDRTIERCSQEASLRAEISRDLDIGVGALWRGEPGSFSDFEDAGAAAWIAYRQPLGALFGSDAEGDPAVKAFWMIAASARVSSDEYLATGDATTPEFQADVFEGWVGLERFTSSFRAAAHYGYRETRAGAATGAAFEQSGERYLVSAQIRLGDESSGLWLGLSHGDASGSVDALDDEATLITLSYSPPPRLNIGH